MMLDTGLIFQALQVVTRNGVKCRSSWVPTDLLTLAPAPSACSIASKIFIILRGVDVLLFKEGSFGGITGRPWKVDEDVGADMVVCGCSRLDGRLELNDARLKMGFRRSESCWRL